MDSSKIEIKRACLRNMSLVLVIIALMILIYYQTINVLLTDWNTNLDYSHGYIIPFISLYMIWHVLKQMKQVEIYPSNWGLLLLVLGISMQMVAVVGSEHFLQGVSIIVVLWSLSLYLGSVDLAKRIAAPIGYLIFMIPLPSIIWNKFSFILKLHATNVAVYLLNLATHIAIMQEGNIIHLTGGSLEVADACSGLRSMVSMLALSVLIAFISRYAMWKRFALVFLAIPVALAANIMRLITLVFLADRYGISVAENFLHTFSGIIVFAIGLTIILFIHSIFLKRIISQ